MAIPSSIIRGHDAAAGASAIISLLNGILSQTTSAKEKPDPDQRLALYTG